MTIPQVQLIIEEILEDESLSRQLKEKLVSVIGILKSNDDVQSLISRALSELEQASDSQHLDSYTRSQLFSATSILESVKVQ